MNNDIRKLIDDNWEDIKELIAKKTEAEQKSKTIWDLKIADGEKYYRLYGDGDIDKVAFNTNYDEQARDIGNAFLTKEEAEFEKERRMIGAVMRKYSRPFADGKINYFLACGRDSKATFIDYSWDVDYGIPCFELEETAQKVIDEIGKDRLKKYWFGVEE